MGRRKPAETAGGRVLGVLTLTLGLVHTPLPQPDFHNIRHQDGPGRVCEFHDHLLRWHPGAGVAQDVAVLHWHWFLPSDLGDDASPAAPGSGPAAHAHVPAPVNACWDHAPTLSSDAVDTSRLLSMSLKLSSAADVLPGVLNVRDHARVAALLRAPAGFGAGYAIGVSPASLLQRWVC